MPQPAAERPARELFPGFAGLYEKFSREVEGLADAQLDFTLPEKSWGLWSIRSQVSHVASVNYRWLLDRWGKTLAAEGHSLRQNPEALYGTGEADRQLNPGRYPTFASILDALRDSFALVQEVVERETEGSLRAKSVTRRIGLEDRVGQSQESAHERHRQVTLRAHPRGIWQDEKDPDLWHYDLEWTLRHMYWEALAHLYTIQKLKEAQGLPARGEVPREGYLVVQRWE